MIICSLTLLLSLICSLIFTYSVTKMVAFVGRWVLPPGSTVGLMTLWCWWHCWFECWIYRWVKYS
eukprot:UN04900